MQQFSNVVELRLARDGLVGIASRYGLDGRGIEFQ
jgi:hypothetical protein